MSARSLRVPVWILVALGATLAAFFFAGGGMPLRRSLLTCYTWALLIWPIVWLDRRLPIPRDALARRAAVHVPLSIAWTIVFLAAISWVGEPILRSTITPEMSSPGVWERVRTGGLQWNAMYYWVLVGGFYAIDYHRESSERQRRAAELERLLTEAQLTALRAQLHPHFLFNALNTIADLIVTNPSQAEAMTLRLSKVFRHVLARSSQPLTSIREEMAFLRTYLDIEEARFGTRLQVHIDVAADVAQEPIPSLILQPLVENALKHGLAPKPGQGHLWITARAQGRHVCVHVEDDGIGLTAEGPRGDSMGVGLNNIAQRLSTFYQGRARVALEPRQPGGTRVTLLVPRGPASPEPERESTVAATS